MGNKARATTNHLGNSRVLSFGVEDVVSKQIENPWLIETVPLQVMKDDYLMLGSTHIIHQIRDNVRGIRQLDVYGTLAMFALQEGFAENRSCKLYINRNAACYDIFIDSQRTLTVDNKGTTYKSQFRKLNNLMYYRQIKTKKGAL